MIAPKEVRAARAMLGWTRQMLADRAVLSLSAVIRFEEDIVTPRPTTEASIRKALERQGIEFLSLTEGYEGVRLRRKRKPKAR